MSGQEYRCANGHDQYDPQGVLTRCQVFVHGSPCPAALTAVGEGAKKANEYLACTAG